MKKEFLKKIEDLLNSLSIKVTLSPPNFKDKVDRIIEAEDSLILLKYTSKRDYHRTYNFLKKSMSTLKKEFKREYKNIRRFKFIIVVEGTFSDNEEIKDKEICSLDSKFMDYYHKLYKVLGEFAKYHLLGEIGVPPRVQTETSYFALKSKLGGYEVYFFFSYPEELLKISYVARRERGEENYYQRLVTKDRLLKIKEFIEKGGIFPNNIIISFDKKPRFYSQKDKLTHSTTIGELIFPLSYRCAWLIDGQHRLYSFVYTNKRDILLPVIGFYKLNREKQAKFFIEINKEQKPVNPNLLWDLEGELRPDTEEGIISNIVKKLDRKNPFKDRIYIPLKGKTSSRRIKMASLCESIKQRKLVQPILESKMENPFYVHQDRKVDFKKLVNYLVNYFQVIDKVFNSDMKEQFIFTNKGLSLMIIFFEKITARLTSLNKKLGIKGYEKYIIYIKKYLESKKIRELKERCASKGGEKSVATEISNYIRNHLDNNFSIGIEARDNKFEEFEKELREFVNAILSKKTPNWLKLCCPSDIYSKILERAKKEKLEEQGGHLYEFLDMGDCIKIIEMRKNWPQFEKIFITTSEFMDKKEVEVALKKIKSLRDPIVHKRSGGVRDRELRIAKEYCEKFREIFKRV
ncbi:MAG: hypothetical protein DRP72_02140 [Candidatus Omnitrophota bacterium]|nr:MAG: hypothetical protein DRP72_02140 [Candidatus Omnitrophota bacterium]